MPKVWFINFKFVFKLILLRSFKVVELSLSVVTATATDIPHFGGVVGVGGLESCLERWDVVVAMGSEGFRLDVTVVIVEVGNCGSVGFKLVFSLVSWVYSFDRGS